MKRLATALRLLTALAFGVQAASRADARRPIKERGELICGANGTLAGFGLPDAQGNWTGLRRRLLPRHRGGDLQRSEQGQIRAADAKDRFTTLQSGEIDVLVAQHHLDAVARDLARARFHRRSTITTARASWCARTLKVNSALELDGAVGLRAAGHDDRAQPRRLLPRQQHEAQDRDLRDRRRGAQGLRQRPLRRLHHRSLRASTASGSRLANPDDHIVLPEIISKEPLGPSVRHGDSPVVPTSCAGRTTPCSTPRSSASPRPMSTRS